MTAVYEKTEITRHEVVLPKIKGYPLLIDDWTIAFYLGFTGKAFWHFLRERDAMYEKFKLPKKSGGTREVHAPKEAFKNFLASLRYHLLVPLTDQLEKHVTAYRKGVSCKHAAWQHVAPCPHVRAVRCTAHLYVRDRKRQGAEEG